MTVYLHRAELEPLLEEIAEIADASPADYIEAHGVCSVAVAGIAMDCSTQATATVEDGRGSYAEAIADAYICGVLLGLMASERIGR